MKFDKFVSLVLVVFGVGMVACGSSDSKRDLDAKVDQVVEQHELSSSHSTSSETETSKEVILSTSSTEETTEQTVIEAKTGTPGDDLEYISVDYSISERYEKGMFSTIYESGEYLVGTDMPVGTYVGFSTGGTASCNVFSGIDKDEKINKNGSWSNYLVIFKAEDGNLVALSQAFCVPLEEVEEIGLEKFGIFKVGETIPEGRYKLEAKDGKEGHCSVLKELDSNTRGADIGFCNRFYVAVREGEILVVGNADFVIPTNYENDDTDKYLINDDKWSERISEGCYRVGIDIESGRYIVYSNHDNGASSVVDIYYNGFIDDKVKHEYVGEAKVLALEEGQYINFDEDSTIIPFEQAYALGTEISHIYIVGTDMEAGTVKLIHTKMDRNDTAVVITETDLDNNEYEGFDIFESQSYFEFHEGEYIFLFDCEIK